MKENIIVCGLNGAGKSTFGRLLAKRLGFAFHDAEEYYFPAVQEEGIYPAAGNPYEISLTKEKVGALLLADLKREEGMVFSSGDGDFGKEAEKLFTSAVLLEVPKEERMRRIRVRTGERFGARAAEGGDFYLQEEAFFRKAEACDEKRSENWLKKLRIPVLRLDGTKDPEVLLTEAEQRFQARRLIRKRLLELSDEAYKDFQAPLIPDIEKEHFAGVRTPELRTLAKELKKNEPEISSVFMKDLPHYYFDEDQLHAFIISEEKEFGRCLSQVEEFMPFVNNWATCDQLSPKAFRKTPEKLLPVIDRWIHSEKTYTIRFAIGCLMRYFLDERFDPAYPAEVAAVHSEEYYVRMMQAWYFATALAKQYEAVLPYITEHRLDPWVHQKSIQKSLESYRIPEDVRNYLRTLRLRH